MPSVVLIHGVSSTGEWHAVAERVLSAFFTCYRIQYRFFHGWWGGLKVYVWPTALFLLVGFAALFLPFGGVPASVAFILLILQLANGLVAERDWVRVREKETIQWLPPLTFAVFGLLAAGAIAMWKHGDKSLSDLLSTRAGHDLSYPLLVALAGVSFFLDLREYADGCDHKPSRSVYSLGSILFMGLTVLALWLFSLRSPWFEEQSFWRQNFWPFVVLGLLLILGVLEPHARARYAFDLVREKLAEISDKGSLPNVIAHSLGTYLVGHILHEAQAFRLRRVILTGCVLERDFPWFKLVRPGYVCFEVRNYAGAKDVVPGLTGLLRGLWLTITIWARVKLVGRWSLAKRWPDSSFGVGLAWRPLGSAGRQGFREDQKRSLSHAHKHQEACAKCKARPPAEEWAPVHSIIFPHSFHSTMNKDRHFQRSFWVSALMGIAREEYETWLDICRTGWDAKQTNDPGRLKAAQEDLLRFQWNWPELISPTSHSRRREFLKWYVKEMLRALPGGADRPPLATIMKRVPLLMIESVGQAWDAANDDDPANDHLLRNLDPAQALAAAVTKALALGP